MNDYNIFEVAKPQGGEFFKFKEIGNSIQGTYIDVRNGIDSFGNQQTIYVIQDAEGKIWNLGFRSTAMIIHERMNGIRFGQIVGFRFDESRDSKKRPGTKVKIIRIYADPKLLDHEWLEHQKEIEKNYTKPSRDAATPETESSDDYGIEENETSFSVPGNAVAASGGFPAAGEVKPRNEAIDAIRNLAKTKGLTNDTMSESEEKEVIEKYTELKLEEQNLTKIIIKLTGFTNQ